MNPNEKQKQIIHLWWNNNNNNNYTKLRQRRPATIMPATLPPLFYNLSVQCQRRAAI